MFKPDIPRQRDALKPEVRRMLGDLLAGERLWPLFLHGDAGRGKTCAALTLYDAVPGALYWTLDELMEYAYTASAWVWFYSQRARLVIVDEIGGRSTETDREYVTLKHMADIREHRPVIWISNLTPAELGETYDDRIHSRLTSGTVVELTGPDRRRASNGIAI
jgi:DNA replication protein DnaC